jgi:glycosidase
MPLPNDMNDLTRIMPSTRIAYANLGKMIATDGFVSFLPRDVLQCGEDKGFENHSQNRGDSKYENVLTIFGIQPGTEYLYYCNDVGPTVISNSRRIGRISGFTRRFRPTAKRPVSFRASAGDAGFSGFAIESLDW